MLAGVLAALITAPVAIAVGGLAVAAFAIGPAMMNREVRRLGTLRRQVAMAEVSGTNTPQPSAAPADN